MEIKQYKDMERSVKFDDEIRRKYRYSLWCRWNESLPQVTFVMLNPSKADENDHDPTLYKCIKFAHNWHYGSLEVVNLFAYVATKPTELPKPHIDDDDPVGLANNSYIQSATKRADLIIVAWGADPYLTKNHNHNRVTEVLSLISGQKTLHCLKLTKIKYPLGLTKKEYPRHPLYIKDSTQPMMFPI
ncbi:DUF1643 domain-containing protein [Nodularia spumigena]|uniref:DUF1643 domain-containing protein n=1 Tax=Nodularia spumigena TaxID=70799 RepID=UPI00232D5F3E|nr:DUF1643 domain-containing protein [Nodularia spumigena]MDB9349859.1 DUF1643 domain-containing protein [Nodularia spumigena CS-588/01]MDB9353478.1 DUF1643 domain-containing protein [Nodularia spumigena CS-588/05]